MDIKTFNQLARDHGFDEIADLKDPKYTTIKDYPVDLYLKHSELAFVDDLDHHEIDYNPDLEVSGSSYRSDDDIIDVTVCYTLWDNPIYVKMLYLSLQSQLLYTDILNVKKFQIVVDRKLEAIVWDIFRVFENSFSGNFELDIKTINSEVLVASPMARNTMTPQRINKYVISLHEDMRETELLILSDCESFMYGKKAPVYRNLYNQYKNTKNFPVLGCQEYPEEGSSVFLDRREQLAGMMENDEEYINWCSYRLNIDQDEFKDIIVNRYDWFLTCWFVFDNEKYATYDQHWRDYVEWSRVYSMYCDESIYLTYGLCADDYDVEDLSFIDGLRFLHSHQCEEFFLNSNYDVTGVVHPLHGEYSEDMWVQDFYDTIQTEFRKTLEYAHENGVSFRDILPQYKE